MESSVIWLFPAFLCLAGLCIQYFLVPRQKKDANVDLIETKPDSPKLIKNIMFYALIALASLVVISTVTPNFLKISNLEITGVDAILFGIMMAIGEERLFRGGLFFRFQTTTKSFFLATIATAGMFVVYHFAVYHDDLSALLYVLSAGIVLAYINVIAGVQSPSLFAHIGANIIAYSPLGTLGILGIMTNPYILLLMGAALAILIIIILRKGGKKR